MSRTWTREKRRRLIRENRAEAEAKAYVEYAAAAAEPETITPEWAVERMSRDITFAVHRLVSEGHVEESQAEDYLNWLSQVVVEAVPKYDPKRTNERGRTSSATNFLRRVLRNRVCTLIESLAVAKSLAQMVHIDAMEAKDADDDEDYREEPWVSDGGRSVREIDWRLDMESMMLRLPPKARVALKMVLLGYDHETIVAATVADRNVYWREIVSDIREVLRDGGYCPLRESA